MHNLDAVATDAAAATARPGRYRWRICALLFAATTINYVDRQVLGVLAPDLQRQLGWSEVEYGSIVTAFQAAYAIGLVSAGAVIDRLGTRLGYALAITLWSLAAMSHALAGSVMGFAMARFALGLGEAGNWPGAAKTIATIRHFCIRRLFRKRLTTYLFYRLTCALTPQERGRTLTGAWGVVNGSMG